MRRCRSAVPLLLVLAGLLPAAEEIVNANVAGPEQAPEVAESATFAAVITVRNPHDRAIRIASIDSSCPCAELSMPDRFLLPRGTATLAVAVGNERKAGPRSLRLSLYHTDPDLALLEVDVWWKVRPHIMVDLLPPGATTAVRPADPAYHNVVRVEPEVRPDEPDRLRRRFRLESPPGEIPPGGLQILGIDYPGPLWAFRHERVAEGVLVLTLTGKGETLPEGEHAEFARVRTNHPLKPVITLHLNTSVRRTAGRHQ